MTNNEILQSDLLDILFENRNKSYGAYTLRKEYNRRLLEALGISMSVILLLFLLKFVDGDNRTSGPSRKDGVIITSIPEMEKPKELEKPKPRTVEQKVAQTKSVDRILLVPDDVPTDMPEQDEIDSSLVSNKNVEGRKPVVGDTVTTKPNPVNGGDKTGSNNGDSFTPSHKEAEYPGGPNAFAAFLQRYLITPEELQPGEKKIVVLRFLVEADGTISKTQVVESAGPQYDREVIRVLRKMPKWNPAEQNGRKVPVYFTQRVSFVGLEQ